MTILATHFTIVLGAWRVRLRLDVDEPREAELDGERAQGTAHAADAYAPVQPPPHYAGWGRG
jgi:hypothetical protein